MALIARVVAEMTPEESAGWAAYIGRKGYRISGTVGLNHWLGGWRDHARYMENLWDQMSFHDQLDHIETCPNLCDVCEKGRAWGACTSCGTDPVEALPPNGTSRCCGSHVSLWGPE